MTPRPRVNLVLYHGVLAPRARWRRRVVAGLPGVGSAGEVERGEDPPIEGPLAAARRPGDRRWADLMRRTFGFDVLACPRCGGRMCWLATIEQAEVIHRILTHLGHPTDVPIPRPGREQPLLPDVPVFDGGAWAEAVQSALSLSVSECPGV